MPFIRTVPAVISVTALAEDRNFVIGWENTRATVIEHWNYLRTFWRGSANGRPANADFGIGLKPTFRCLCKRVLPVYLAQVDHVLAQEQIANSVQFSAVSQPNSPGPIRQRIVITVDEANVVQHVAGVYLVEYLPNPPAARRDIGRYGVDPGTGIIRATVWNNSTRRESMEVFEFANVLGTPPVATTPIVHPGDPHLALTIKDLLVNDLCNLQLMCGPCNAAKQERSYHYFQGQSLDSLFQREHLADRY